MKKILTVILSILIATTMSATSVAQGDKSVRKLHIRSADPYLIMMLLSGTFVDQPETSTITKTPTMGGNGGFGGSGFGGSSSGGRSGGNGGFGNNGFGGGK